MATFISAEIEAIFAEEPVILKRAGPPDAFVWDGERFEVSELLAEWHDYDKERREVGETRRSQTQINRQRGSWGLGRDYYRVRTADGRVFELYYNRRPKSRTVIGSWVLYRELDELDLLLL
jgi:hypothetical protein